MNRTRCLLLLAGAVALGVWAWAGLFPNPQKIIEKRLIKLGALASFAPGEGNIKRLANAERMESLFAENIQVTLEAPGAGRRTFDHREELMQAALASRSFANRLAVSLVDINVVLDSDRQSATADATLKARIGQEDELFVQPLKFTFHKTNDEWLVTGIETVKSLH